MVSNTIIVFHVCRGPVPGPAGSCSRCVLEFPSPSLQLPVEKPQSFQFIVSLIIIPFHVHRRATATPPGCDTGVSIFVPFDRITQSGCSRWVHAFPCPSLHHFLIVLLIAWIKFSLLISSFAFYSCLLSPLCDQHFVHRCCLVCPAAHLSPYMCPHLPPYTSSFLPAFGIGALLAAAALSPCLLTDLPVPKHICSLHAWSSKPDATGLQHICELYSSISRYARSKSAVCRYACVDLLLCKHCFGVGFWRWDLVWVDSFGAWILLGKSSLAFGFNYTSIDPKQLQNLSLRPILVKNRFLGSPYFHPKSKLFHQ